MFTWIAQNLANIIIVLLLAAIVAGIIFKMIRDRQAGKTSCSCGCSSCAMSGQCHKMNREYEKMYRKWKREKKHRTT